MSTELDAGKLPADLRADFEAAGMKLPEGDIAIKADDKAKGPVKKWTFQAKVGDGDARFLRHAGRPAAQRASSSSPPTTRTRPT